MKFGISGQFYLALLGILRIIAIPLYLASQQNLHPSFPICLPKRIISHSVRCLCSIKKKKRNDIKEILSSVKSDDAQQTVKGPWPALGDFFLFLKDKNPLICGHLTLFSFCI